MFSLQMLWAQKILLQLTVIHQKKNYRFHLLEATVGNYCKRVKLILERQEKMNEYLKLDIHDRCFHCFQPNWLLKLTDFKRSFYDGGLKHIKLAKNHME